MRGKIDSPWKLSFSCEMPTTIHFQATNSSRPSLSWDSLPARSPIPRSETTLSVHIFFFPKVDAKAVQNIMKHIRTNAWAPITTSKGTFVISNRTGNYKECIGDQRMRRLHQVATQRCAAASKMGRPEVDVRIQFLPQL